MFFKSAFFIVSLTFVTHLFAANGIFLEGYGVKAKGMGGAAIGLPQDSMTGANNPAGFALIGNRFDLAIQYVKVHAYSQVKGNSLPGGNVKAYARNDIFIPEGGLSYQYSDCLSLGVSLFGRGAANSFGRNLGALNGQKKAYAQDNIVYCTPSVAWRPFNNNHIFGVGVNLCLSYFKINGLENLGPSLHPKQVSNNNFDWEPGIGVRFGWLWEALPCLNIGATFETPTWIQKYKRYKGLIPDSGNGNVPANFGFGIGWRVLPKWLLGMDIMRILWSSEPLFGNRATLNHPFGAKKGTGLGWKDQTVFKVGLAWEASSCLTLRAGYNHGTYQIPPSQTLANMSIMLISERHATCGLTYQLDANQELNLCYIHAFNHLVKGRNSIPPVLGGGEARISYCENWAVIGYGRTF